MKKLLAVVLLVCSFGLSAQTFPAKPVKIIVALPVGSGPDVIIRKVADQLSTKWAVPVVVENRPGGGGAVGLNAFNSEPVDGYTLFFADVGTVAGYPILYNDTKIVENLAPVRPVIYSELMLFASSKIQNGNDLKTALKANPTMGSWGVGSPAHINDLVIADAFGINATHVPYKDYGQWFIDTSNQQVTAGFASMASAGKMEKSGKIRYIAVTGDRRDFANPDVPTVKELTGKNIKTLASYVAVYTNKKVDPAIQKKLIKDFDEVVNSNSIKVALLTVDYRPMPISVDEFKAYANEQYNLYKKLIKQYNISIN
jgi:tripartite-type tricarboxylate transporter receptor subunit TctC